MSAKARKDPGEDLYRKVLEFSKGEITPSHLEDWIGWTDEEDLRDTVRHLAHFLKGFRSR